MSRRPAHADAIMIFVFDMDGALLRVDVDLEEIRTRLAALFAPRGVTRPFRPILRRLREAGREVGDPALETAGLAIVDEWERRGAAEARARAGAADVVGALAERGDRLGVVTALGRASVAPALAAAGVPPRFAAIAARDDAADKAAAIAQVVAALGGGAGWYVVDHPSDVPAGRAAGLRVAAIGGGLPSDVELRNAGADVVLATLDELLALPR